MVGRDCGARQAVSNKAPFKTKRSEYGDFASRYRKSLHREILKQFLKRPALRARLVEQALPDGGADIASAHSMASRYGRMIFWTRLIWANFVRAALFGFRVRSRYARSASMAMSRPILFRYLKQSAIVFSGE